MQHYKTLNHFLTPEPKAPKANLRLLDSTPYRSDPLGYNPEKKPTTLIEPLVALLEPL